MQKSVLKNLLFFSLTVFLIKNISNFARGSELKLNTGFTRDYLAEEVDNFFDPLPTKKEIIKRDNIGKVDPFSLEFEDNILNKFGPIKLLGVFSTRNKNYAILNFGNLTGEILEGSIGGKDTNLLPENVLLRKIEIKESIINLVYQNKEYQLKIK